MSDQPKVYIAGIGMITPVGFDTASTAAAVKAGVSGYTISQYYGQNDEPITMAMVPEKIFLECDAEVGEGSRYNDRHDRVIKMAILAIREACEKLSIRKNIPLVLAMPEEQSDEEGLTPLLDNLEQNCKPWVNSAQSRKIHSGRAAGMDAINFVFRYLDDIDDEYVLIGGSDSYQDDSRLQPLNEADRLLVRGNMDGFAPGEAAGFIVLTREPGLAMQRQGHVIALQPPGIAEETGHLNSVEPYRGDGLDQAFKKALENSEETIVDSIYSSMNGENHWAKEYGVAYHRNRSAFKDSVELIHPAECYGDLGAATSAVMIGLAAEALFGNPDAKKYLVYSSSDNAKRGAVMLQKISMSSLN